MDKSIEMTVLVPVTQYVRVEGAAAADSLSLDDTASFLLSQWVQATRGKDTVPSAARSSNRRAAERIRKA